MTKKYTQIIGEQAEFIAKLRKEIPDTIQSFSQLVQAGTKPGALDTKTKELITIGIAIAARCEGCIGLHMKKLAGLGVTREEILETLSVAIFMGGGPSYIYAAEALQAFEEFSD